MEVLEKIKVDATSTYDETPFKVEKRDGRIVDFDEESIKRAITSAFKNVRKKNGENLTANDENTINDASNLAVSKIRGRYEHSVSIEEIQSIVESVLLEDFHLEDVFDAYSEYRIKRMKERAQSTDANEAVKRFLHKDPTIMNENANKDSTVYGVARDLLAGAVSKASFYRIAPKDVSNAHAKGDIHFHDADYSLSKMTNCSLPNFKDMLANGFKLGNAFMSSPKSIEIASTQVSQIILNIASNQYGGQTVNRADEIFAPYAKKNYAKNYKMAEMVLPDEMNVEQAKKIVQSLKDNENERLHIPERPAIHDEPFEEETTELGKQRSLYAQILTRKNIYDAMQTFEYQTNSCFSSNGQTPFITVGFGLGTDWFAREITRAIFLIRIAGLGVDHRTAIFPKLTYAIKHGVNSEPQDPNYDLKQLALECSSKRMYPDILFVENIAKITGDFKAPMGCRSFLQAWKNPDTGEYENDGRMNLGVVSVNLPRIAIESNGSIKRFWKLFDQRMEVAHHALQFRIQRTRTASPANAPVLWEYGAFGRLQPTDSVDSLMNRSRATVSLGYIGLYEVTARFYGKNWVNDWGWDEDAHQFAISIVRKMDELCKQWESEEGYHYSVYGTPAESLTDRFNRMDKEKFGKVDGITDKDFYTNSFHRPVWISGNPKGEPSEGIKEVMARPNFHMADDGGAASKLDFEQPYLQYTSGGHIVYVEYPSMRQNLKGLEAVWDYAHEVGVDYLGTNTPIDECHLCGYKGDFAPTETGYQCPICKNEDPNTCVVTKRVCGYLGEPQLRRPIKGRHAELESRVKEINGETGRISSSTGNVNVFYVDRAVNPHKN